MMLVFNSRILLILIFKLLHFALVHSVLYPFYTALFIIVPYISHDEVFLCAKLSFSIYVNLIICGFPSCFVNTSDLCSVNINDHISVWCTTSVYVTRPPCTTSSTYVVLVKMFI